MEKVIALFTVVLQDFLDMKLIASMDNLNITVRAYEQRRSPRQQVNPASTLRVQTFSPLVQSHHNRHFAQYNSF